MASPIKIDLRDAIRTIRRANRDLNKSVVDAAIVSALNHTVAKGKTAANREIRNVYKIKARDIAKNLSTKKATKGNQVAAIIAVGRPIGLISFNPKKTRKGVSVNIMGKRKLIKGAFIATMKSGHKGVFGRGDYTGDGGFKWRRKRVRKTGNDNPITELKSVALPTALSNDIILRHVTTKLNNDFPKRLTHELSRRRSSI